MSEQETITTLQRALAESQAIRDEQSKRLGHLSAEVAMWESWYPLEIQGRRIYLAMCGEDDPESWLAAFRDKDDADTWAKFMAERPDENDRRTVFVIEGEAAGIRFWNNGVDPVPEVSAKP